MHIYICMYRYIIINKYIYILLTYMFIDAFESSWTRWNTWISCKADLDSLDIWMWFSWDDMGWNMCRYTDCCMSFALCYCTNLHHDNVTSHTFNDNGKSPFGINCTIVDRGFVSHLDSRVHCKNGTGTSTVACLQLPWWVTILHI